MTKDVSQSTAQSTAQSTVFADHVKKFEKTKCKRAEEAQGNLALYLGPLEQVKVAEAGVPCPEVSDWSESFNKSEQSKTELVWTLKDT